MNVGNFPYKIELDHGRAVITLLPELNDVAWADIERIGGEILSRLSQMSSPALLVDLCHLNYMGSAQVALVVRLYKFVKEKSGKMVVSNRDPLVREVLNLAGLNKIWHIVDSREAGMAALGGVSHAQFQGNSSGNAYYPTLFAIIDLVLAAVLLGAVLGGYAGPPPREILLYASALFGAIAFLLGLWGAMTGNSQQKMVLFLAVIGSLGILVTDAVQLTRPIEPLPQKPAEDDQAEGEGEEQTKREGEKGEAKTDVKPAGAAGKKADAEKLPDEKLPDTEKKPTPEKIPAPQNKPAPEKLPAEESPSPAKPEAKKSE